MTTEIDKMFENAGVKKAPDINNCYPEMMKCHHCEHYKVINEYTGRCLNEVYPKFTAGKQLNIIQLISKQGQIIIENWEKDNRGFNVTFRANSNLRYITMDCITRKTIEDALAQIINDIWQDLTDQEKEEIRNILNA